MIPQPINESQASDEIKKIYSEIKEVFDTPYVPMMFRYIANYPILLERMWQPIKTNLTDPQFDQIIKQISNDVVNSTELVIQNKPDLITVTNQLVPAVDTDKVLAEIEKYYEVQIKLAFISIAIRERVKGWAIGAKYLTDAQDISETIKTHSESSIHEEIHEMAIAEVSSALVQREDIRETLLKYIIYIHEEFTSIIKHESYVFSRVQSEKHFSQYLPNMPYPIFASYNEVAKSIKDKNDLPDVFFLLAEKFPVAHAVSALMWATSIKLLRK